MQAVLTTTCVCTWTTVDPTLWHKLMTRCTTTFSPGRISKPQRCLDVHPAFGFPSPQWDPRLSRFDLQSLQNTIIVKYCNLKLVTWTCNWNFHRNEKVCSFHSRSATYYYLPSQHTRKFNENLPTSTSNSYCCLKHLRNWWFVEQGLDSIKELILQPSRGRGYWQNFEIKKHKFSFTPLHL